MREMVKEIREELLNTEMSLIDLDNNMCNKGYYSVTDEGCEENIKEDGNVVYTAKDEAECGIKIDFVITENESEGVFDLKVTEVEEF